MSVGRVYTYSDGLLQGVAIGVVALVIGVFLVVERIRSTVEKKTTERCIEHCVCPLSQSFEYLPGKGDL